MPATKSLGTVSTSDVEIVTASVCDLVQVSEAAQAGTTAFQFRGANSSDYVTKVKGQMLTLTRQKGYWEKGVTLGYIKRVDADANFDQIETP
jgi:hypothetical protein